MAEMLTILPPENYGTGEKIKTPPVCIDTKPPVFIEYSPDYKRAHGLSNEIDRLPKGQLERTPDQDGFEFEKDDDYMMGNAANLKAFKAPSPKEIIAAATIAKEVIDVLTDAVKSGHNLYEAIVNWVNSDKNKNMSDSQKVQAMQLANVMAKQISGETPQKPMNLAA